MSSTRLNPLDAAWIVTESRATPNHVGGLLQFKLPPDAPQDFLRRLMAEFRSYRKFTAPWNRKLKHAFTLNPVAEWVEDRNIDLEYHVRHAALPWPGGERELGELVGRLEKDGYRLLVIQQASCVSREQMAAVQRFVERGGTLVAIGRVGLRDVHGTPHPEGPLADALTAQVEPAGTPGTEPGGNDPVLACRSR